jgi:hypothetical protein
LTAGAGPGAGEVSGGMRAATTLPGAAVRPGARARRLAPFAVAAVGVAAGIAGGSGPPGARARSRRSAPRSSTAGRGVRRRGLRLALQPRRDRGSHSPVLRDPARPRAVRAHARPHLGAVRELAARPAPDRPFWSPDAAPLAFFAAGTLRVVAPTAGRCPPWPASAGAARGLGPDDTSSSPPIGRRGLPRGPRAGR